MRGGAGSAGRNLRSGRIPRHCFLSRKRLPCALCAQSPEFGFRVLQPSCTPRPAVSHSRFPSPRRGGAGRSPGPPGRRCRPRGRFSSPRPASSAIRPGTRRGSRSSGRGRCSPAWWGARPASLPNFGLFEGPAEFPPSPGTRPLLDKVLLSRPWARWCPGTMMPMTVPNPDDRSDLIAYLASLRSVKEVDDPARAPSPGRIHHHPRTAGDWQNDAPGVRITGSTWTTCRRPTPRSRPEIPRARWTSRPGRLPLRPGGLHDQPVRHRPRRPAPPAHRAERRHLHRRDHDSGISGSSGRPTGRTIPSANLGLHLRACEGRSASRSTRRAQTRSGSTWATLNSVVRFPYRNGDLVARGPAEKIVPLLSDSTGGHSTRDVVFSRDGKRMFISVGSGSNVAETMESGKPRTRSARGNPRPPARLRLGLGGPPGPTSS